MRSQKDTLELRPIGILRSVFPHKFGTPRQGALAPSSHAKFNLDESWRGMGLFCGLNGFSHVWLVSYFHQNKNTRRAGKVHPPRLLGRAVGSLASRTPHRPNPLGLTLAKLERVDGDTLFLSGVDLVDGTPILDIKPYLAEADRPTEFASGWAGELSPPQIACEFSPEALAHIEALRAQGQITDRERFMQLVREVLVLDPRPLAYRARVNERFAVVLGHLDVHARFHENVFTVVEVRLFPFAAAAATSK